MVCYVVAELGRIAAHVKKIRVTIFARPAGDFKWPVVKDEHDQKRQGFL